MRYGAAMAVPADRRYSTDHQWIQRVGEAWRVGLTAFAQDALGDVTMVQLKLDGATIGAGDEMGEVEAFKAMTDLYMPVAAELTKVNDDVIASPSLINEDPYGAGWLCEVRVLDPGELDALLDADGYAELIGASDG